MVLKLTRRREAALLSKQKLSFLAQVPASTLGQIESGRFVPYPPQLTRIAEALDFQGDPRELLEPSDSQP